MRAGGGRRRLRKKADSSIRWIGTSLIVMQEKLQSSWMRSQIVPKE